MVKQTDTVVHVQQAQGSRVCGQCCVAMLCQLTIDKAVELVGRKGGTYHKDLTPVLVSFGWQPNTDKMVRFKEIDEIPEVALIKVWWREGYSGSHWVLKVGDWLHDPGLPARIKWSDKYLSYNRNSKQDRMTSYIELRSFNSKGNQ